LVQNNKSTSAMYITFTKNDSKYKVENGRRGLAFARASIDRIFIHSTHILMQCTTKIK